MMFVAADLRKIQASVWAAVLMIAAAAAALLLLIHLATLFGAERAPWIPGR